MRNNKVYISMEDSVKVLYNINVYLCCCHSCDVKKIGV